MDKKNIKIYNQPECLGPCYFPGTQTIHPSTFQSVKNITHSYCHINPTYDYVSGTMKYVNYCDKPTASVQDITTLQTDVLNLNTGFTVASFLHTYYNITNVEEFINWLNNNKDASIYTKVRLFDGVLKVFNQVINIIDDTVAKLVIEIIKKLGMKRLYKQINEYIGVNNAVVKIVNPKDNKLNKKDQYVLRINYIVETFLNKNVIRKFVSKFIKQYSDEFNQFESPTNIMLKSFENYVISKIKNSLSD